MRDINRIDKFCAELAELWKEVPDWRFGQFICNTFGNLGGDPFFIEDDKMMEKLTRLIGPSIAPVVPDDK